MFNQTSFENTFSALFNGVKIEIILYLGANMPDESYNPSCDI